MKTIESVKKAEAVKRIVSRCISSRTWRSECEQEALAWVEKAEREAVKRYVREQYDAAGAGPSGRW